MPDAEIHVAVVYGRGRVDLVVMTPTKSERNHRVAEYVRRRTELLSPDSRGKVLSLLRRGATEGAIQTYFDVIGPEWDDEWLHFETRGASRLGIEHVTARRTTSIA